MKKLIPGIICFVLMSLVPHGLGWCISGADMVRLQKNGIDGETIQTIIREKVIETCALSVQEIVEMKKSGMSNKTIRTVVENASFMKDTQPIDYTKNIKTLDHIGVGDVIALKKAGVSDDVILSIVSAVKSDDERDRERAWDMLKNMGLIVDDRP